jgi:hypothetical protein
MTLLLYIPGGTVDRKITSADRLNAAAEYLGLKDRVKDGYLASEFSDIVSKILLSLAHRVGPDSPL